MRCIKALIILHTLCITLICSVSYGLHSDAQQPMKLIADSVVYNQETGIGTYRGNVRMDQGTTHLRANTLITYNNPQQQFIKAVATGHPATYRTLPRQKQATFHAQATHIEYLPPQALVKMQGNALAWQAEYRYQGPKINYDIAKQLVTSPASKDGRTTLVIKPRDVSHE